MTTASAPPDTPSVLPEAPDETPDEAPGQVLQDGSGQVVGDLPAEAPGDLPLSLADPPSDRCRLAHRGFTVLGDIVFRRSKLDNLPVVIVQLGPREAALPLRSLQREMDIADDSSDGRMLLQIAEALEYVWELKPGDLLPAEVRTGEASWKPGRSHQELALSRLRMQLVAWLARATDDASIRIDAFTSQALESEPALRATVQRAFALAATTLGVPDGDAVMTAMETVAHEMGYIESLRDLLLGRVQALSLRLDALGHRARGDATRLDALTQVQRLIRIALVQINARFAEIDAQTGEVIATLRNFEAQRSFIRSNRDWLHRSRRAWDEILGAWEATPPGLRDEVWTLIARTYQFMAPRFMPVTEWVLQADRSRGRPPPKAKNVLQW